MKNPVLLRRKDDFGLPCSFFLKHVERAKGARKNLSDIHNMFVLGLGRVPWCPRDGSGRPITRVQIFYPLPEV